MAHSISLLFLLSLLSLAYGALNVSNTLGSNMVLQRAPLQANIWGWASPGDKIALLFNGQTLGSTAGADGSWSVLLPVTQAGGPYEIDIQSSSGGKLSLTNILFGDVWVCSGQSNMQFTVDSAYNSTYEVALANNYPNVRVFSVGVSTIAGNPLTNLAKIDLPWSVASSQSIGGGNWTYMSAVCWFFGRDLYDTYKVPIGLISTNWGGTYIQAWSSPDALKQCNVTIPPFNQTLGPNQPAALWNSMVVPFLPQTIRGAIWYQAESNVGQTALYACLEPVMITDWRSKFGSGFKFPFLFVQLAPWIDNDVPTSIAVADIRVAQLSALALPSVGYASAIDLGDPVSPFNPIHPRNKQEVGRRLVLAARNIAYGETSVVWQGPTFSSATQSVSNLAAVVQVTFTTYGEGGLHFRPAICPPEVLNTTCSNWQLLLSDGNWYDATSASLSSTPNVITVIVANLQNQQLTIKGVRYAYAIWPLTSIFSGENLPAIPFEYYFS